MRWCAVGDGNALVESRQVCRAVPMETVHLTPRQIEASEPVKDPPSPIGYHIMRLEEKGVLEEKGYKMLLSPW
jgi:hypothetical protein